MLEFEARLGVCPQANEVASTQDKRNPLEESLPRAVRKSLLAPLNLRDKSLADGMGVVSVLCSSLPGRSNPNLIIGESELFPP